MKLIISFCLICLMFSACNTSISDTASFGKKGVDDSIVYVNRAIAFIKEVENKSLSDSSFIIYTTPAMLEQSGCWDDIKSHCKELTKDEIEFISTKKYLTIDQWRKEWFPATSFIDKDTLKKPGYDNPEAFLAFKKRYGNGFNSLSFPVFLRNYTYCLYYSENHCGTLCGHGVLNLYKRKNGKWIVEKRLCYWIS